jgi:hypothetical protein
MFILVATAIACGCGDGKQAAGEAAKDEIVFSRGKPALPAAVDRYQPGLSTEKFKALPPPPKRVGGYDVDVTIDDDAKIIGSVSMLLPRDTAKGTLEAAWGPGKQGKRLSKTLVYWFDPDAGLRATLTDSGARHWMSVSFDRYLPADKLLATLTTEPPLGMTREALKEKYKDVPVNDSGDSFHLRFPPTEFDEYFAMVSIGFKNDKSKLLMGSVSYGGVPGAKEQQLAAFQKAKLEPTDNDIQGAWRFEMQAPAGPR